jgi:transcriptional regulator with XRE-family HTH domain
MANGTNHFRLSGKALRLIRISKGLEQKDVAKALNVTQAYISQCETGERILNADYSQKFLELFGIDEEDARLFDKALRN